MTPSQPRPALARSAVPAPEGDVSNGKEFFKGSPTEATAAPGAMRIVVIGAGYVGLVSAACFAELGHWVTAVEANAARLAALCAGQVPFFEPDLQSLLTAQLAHGRLRFTARLGAAVADAELVFIAVGTPPRDDGSADLAAVESAFAEIQTAVSHPVTVVLKSTVPVGTHRRLTARRSASPGHRIVLLNNPEFLREGSAVGDFLRPDRILIGAESTAEAQPLVRAYGPLLAKGVPLLCTDPASAELGKYASNAMLAARISFMNEMAQIADATGADIEEVRQIVGSDPRIGSKFLKAGIGYGGSCFPKDVRALTCTARHHGLDAPLLRGVEQTNTHQTHVLFDSMARHYGGALHLRGKRIALWGLAFKPGTDDLREAPSLVLLTALSDMGVVVAAYDPVAVPAAEGLLSRRFPSVRWCADAASALQGAHALVVATEWDEFRRFAPAQACRALSDRVVFDGRNCLPDDDWRQAGMQVVQIGRPQRPPAPTPDTGWQAQRAEALAGVLSRW